MRNPVARGSAACLAAAIIPATIIAIPIATGSYPLIYAFMVWGAVFCASIFYAAVFGIPFYFAVKRFNLARWWISLIGGFLIGSVPSGILMWLDYRYELAHQVRNSQQIIDLLAAGGHIDSFPPGFFYMAAGFGVVGMLGGFAGWLVLRLTKPSSNENR